MTLIQTVNIGVVDQIEPGRGPQMELDGYQGYMAYVRHFPNKWSKLTTSMGSIQYGSNGVKSNIYEWVSFNNSQEVSTQYPITGIISWGIYGAVEDLEGNSINKYIIKIDVPNSRFIATQPCYADIEIQYNSAFTTLKYLPQITGNTTKYGVIRSRLNYQVAQFRVPPPTLGESEVELCRVISYYVIAELDGERGSYELPDDFPQNTGYPITPKTIEEEGSLKVERAHEIVSVSQSGTTWSQRYYAEILEPYKFSSGYEPKYYLKKATSPGEDWQAVFANVKWEALKDTLESRYQGLQEEGG